MEKKDALELILSGERLTKKVKSKRGIFVIAFPLPKDLRKIEINVARMMDGLAAKSFDRTQIASFRAYATLDEVILDGPEWWNKLESSEGCPDDELITYLYGRYLRFYQSTQKAINESGYGRDDGVGKSKTKSEVVGD